MAWYSFFVTAGLYLWSLFVDWLRTIFIIPFQNADMLWLLVPVWLAWFFAEFFQEKQGTSMGNAISNAVVILWGSIDCARQTTYWVAKHPGSVIDAVLRYSLVALIFVYGAVIVWLGVRGNHLIRYIGRIRQVTYVFIMFVPIFYGAIPFSLNHIVGAVIYFPIFYFIVELLDRYTPDPKAITIDLHGTHHKPEAHSQQHSQQSFVPGQLPSQNQWNRPR